METPTPASPGSNPVVLSCGQCGKKIRVLETSLGKSVRCPLCQTVFKAEVPLVLPPAESDVRADRPARKPSVRDRSKELEEDDRPRRKRRLDEDDDDDRPRLKRKPASGKKGLVLALIAVTLLLSVAAGIVVYKVALGDADVPAGKKDLASADERFKAPVQPAEWQTVEGANGMFRVLMPEAPKLLKYERDRGIQTMNYYLNMFHMVYSVSYFDLPLEQAKSVPVDQRLDGGHKHVSYHYNKSLVKSEKPIVQDDCPGRECVFDSPNQYGTLIVRVFIVDNRTYIVMAGRQNFTPESPEVRKFFDSFHFTRTERKPIAAPEPTWPRVKLRASEVVMVPRETIRITWEEGHVQSVKAPPEFEIGTILRGGFHLFATRAKPHTFHQIRLVDPLNREVSLRVEVTDFPEPKNTAKEPRVLKLERSPDEANVPPLTPGEDVWFQLDGATIKTVGVYRDVTEVGKPSPIVLGPIEDHRFRINTDRAQANGRYCLFIYGADFQVMDVPLNFDRGR